MPSEVDRGKTVDLAGRAGIYLRLKALAEVDWCFLVTGVPAAVVQNHLC